MNEQSQGDTNAEGSIWIRVLFMFLFALAFGISETIIFVLAVVALVLRLTRGQVDDGIRRFGKAMGVYVQQITSFLTFNTEQRPFPFDNWPSFPDMRESGESGGGGAQA